MRYTLLSKAIAVVMLICMLLTNTACTDFFSLSGNEFLTPNGKAKHYSEKELTELYFANADAFLAAANVLLENEQVVAYMREKGEVDYGISHQYDKRFFSDEQWVVITEIFEIAHPHMLMRCRKIDDIVYFTFSMDSESHSTVALYYFPTPSDDVVAFYSSQAFTESFYPIDDNWWIEVTVLPPL